MVSNMLKLFNKLKYKYDLFTAYSDFLEVSAIAISNAVCFNQEKENRYFQIKKKYLEEDFEIFTQLLIKLCEELEKNYNDVLGQLYMELGLGSKWHGQFFTPYHVCKLTASLTCDNIDDIIKQKGFITLNEPCVGGGAMPIAYAEIMKNKGYNPQKQLLVIAQDLDIKAVHMSYIQLSLLGIPAVVYHMNTLSLEAYSEWKTPFWIINNGDRRWRDET